MKKNFSRLPLRKGVGIVLLNNENKIFVAKRIDNPKNFWQMPQGGIDEGESYYKAALRELEEETSIVSVELIKEIDEKLTYILPDNLIGIIWRGRFKGQIQKWFVLRFIGNETEIKPCVETMVYDTTVKGKSHLYEGIIGIKYILNELGKTQ